MKLKETELYLGDNGRVFCGRLRCAGSTAFASGRDLSGQKVMMIRADDVRADGLDPKVFKCETCSRPLAKSRTSSAIAKRSGLRAERSKLSGISGSIYDQINGVGTEAFLAGLVDAAAVSALALDRAGLAIESRAWIKFANATKALGRELQEAARDSFAVDPGPEPSIEDREIRPSPFADTVRNHIVVERTSGTISTDGRRTFVRNKVEFLVVDKRLPVEAQGRDAAPKFRRLADADRSALLCDMFPDRFKTAECPKDSADLKPKEA